MRPYIFLLSTFFLIGHFINQRLIADVVELPTTSVKVSRFRELNKNLASNIQVIKRQDIENSIATNIVELLQKDTNLFFKSYSSNASNAEIGMRGYGENSGQRVLVLLDGHRLNTADLNGIDWLSVPLALVENIEIVRGNQTALYGNNASSGVIRITTRRPSQTFIGSTSTQFGSFDSFNFRSGATGSSGDLGYAFHLEHDETEGYRDNSQYEATGGGISLKHALSQSLESYITLTASNNKYGLPGGLTRNQYATNPQQTTDPDNYGISEAVYLRGGVDCKIDDELSFNLDAGYTDREIDSYYSGFIFGQQYDLSSLTPSLYFKGEGYTSICGVDWMEDQIYVGTDYLERDRLGFFTNLLYEISPTWNVSSSVRYDESKSLASNASGNDSVSDDQYAWSLGVVRKLDATRFYTSLSRFYRFPAIDEIANTFPVPTFNPELKAETGHELDFGFESIFNSSNFGFSIFYRELNDEVLLDKTVGFFGTNVNLARTIRYGFELNSEIELEDSLHLSLDYNWTNAEIDMGENKGRSIPLVPVHQLKISIDWQTTESLTFTASTRYSSAFYAAGDFSNTAGELDEHIVIDLSARYLVIDNIEIFAGVDNLLDVNYVSTAISDGFGNIDAFYPASGRSASIGIKYRY